MPFQHFLSSPTSRGSSPRVALILGMALALGACGYKGPLYMPPPPPAPQENLTSPPSGPDTPSVISPQSATAETPAPDPESDTQ